MLIYIYNYSIEPPPWGGLCGDLGVILAFMFVMMNSVLYFEPLLPRVSITIFNRFK